MILAQNATQALLLMVLGMLCWGLWAGMFQLTGKWRYELFYFDVAIGVAIAVTVYAFTVGSLGYDGFSFMDDLMHCGKRQWLMAFGAGALFNLSNMIMLGGVVVAGMSVSLALGLGGSLMLGTGISLIFSNTANHLLMFLGSACLLVSLVMIAVAYSFLISARQDQMVQAGTVKTTSSVPGYNKGMIVSTNAPSATKGLLLAIVAGALMWTMLPLLNKARTGDFGMGPYSMAAMFAVGMFVSTFVFNLFFVNLPVEGEPVDILAFFQASIKQHLIGIGAGVVLCTGIVAVFVAQQGSPDNSKAWFTPTTWYALRQCAVLVGALYGIFKLKDFRDAEPRVRMMVWLFLLLFTVGVAAIGLAGSFAPAAV
jgi:glucose uptake protein